MFKITSLIIGSFFIVLGEANANEFLLGKEKSKLCSSCHGLNGNSIFPLTPKLAGQNVDYIVNQLKAFKTGRRNNDTMKLISQSLSNIEMFALATFYSTQDSNILNGNALLIKKGKEKYSMCWGCHGNNGEGPGSYPRIAGQHSQYTTQQLNNYKKGVRFNPVMNAVVAELSVIDMEALGAYIATLSPD